MTTYTELQEARFWAKVRRGRHDECWPWTAAHDGHGYGVFGVGQRRVEKAHRVALRMAGVEVPPRVYVCHICDNPACVNPAHLYVGTPLTNSTDKIRRGRDRGFQPGDAHWNARLRSDDLPRIRAMAAEGSTQQTIAGHFGVSQSAISRVLSGARRTPNPARV